MSSRACEAGQSGAGVRLASGHRGRFSGNGCQADPVGCLCLQVLLRLCRTRSDRDCEDGIVVFGWQSGWGGTPSVGPVSVSMSAWGWGRHWEWVSAGLRGTEQVQRCRTYLAHLGLAWSSLVSCHQL